MDTLHNFVTNDYFVLFTGLTSVISFGMAFFAVNQVTKIKMNRQKQSGRKNKQAGGDIH